MNMMKSLRKTATGFALATLAVGLFATPARAVVTLNPGQQITGITVDGNFEPAGSVLVAGPLVINGTTTNAGGSYTMIQEVYKEAGGTYDFLYQVKNTGSSTITAFSPTNYLGYTTLVGYETFTPSGFSVGTVGTSTVSRSFDGAILTYTFDGAGLGAGQTSYVFLAQTNAKSFDQNGTAQLSDNTGTANGGGTINFIYQPAPLISTPEPGSVALLGGFAAVAGLAALRRRKSA